MVCMLYFRSAIGQKARGFRMVSFQVVGSGERHNRGHSPRKFLKLSIEIDAFLRVMEPAENIYHFL